MSADAASSSKLRRAARDELHQTYSLVEQATRTAHEGSRARRAVGKAMRSTVPRASHSPGRRSPFTAAQRS